MNLKIQAFRTGARRGLGRGARVIKLSVVPCLLIAAASLISPASPVPHLKGREQKLNRRADRTPKRPGQRLLGDEAPLQTAAVAAAFYVYQDADSPANHYKPTGYMGDIGDFHIDEAFEEKPHSGKTCIRITYEAKGKGPNQCPYAPPCKWAGVYWQEPPNNWGRDEVMKGKGFDLSGYNRLVFWARADSESTIEFKVGGINETYGDSLAYARSKRARLNKNWQEYEIDLTGANLKHIIGGFCWVTNWDANPGGVTFYLDDIRFEKK